MSDYIIATSSTSDLPRTWLEEHNIPFIAYSYTVNDEPREDDCREETRAAVYAGMRRGDKLHTSMINEFVYYDFLKTFLDEGKDVIFLDMSQKMSVSFVNANKAADKLRAEFPERKLYVMDTLCISGGLGLLVMNMVRRKEAGAGFDEVVAWGEENKLRIAHRFTVDDLNHLKRGGRVSATAAFVGTMLGIKPVMHTDSEGRLIPMSKARGTKAALKALVDKVEELGVEPDKNQPLFICHANCPDSVAYVKELLEERFGVTDVRADFIGPVIGAHTGCGTLGLFFVGTQR